MNTFLRIILDIITLGIFEIIIYSKVKKLSKTKNDELIYSKKYKFKINDFINDLGGINNIENISYTLSSIKINFKNINLVNSELQKKYQIKGITKSINSMILIFGDNAKTIANDINELLNNLNK